MSGARFNWAYGEFDRLIQDHDIDAVEDWLRRGVPPTNGNGRDVRRIVLTDEAELEAMEETPWQVEGIIPEKALGLLFGASETYKSFIALDLALHITLGLDYHGRAVQRGPVVYVAAEGYFGMKKRLAAWKKYRGVEGKLGIYFLRHSLEVRRGSADLSGLREAIREKVGGPVAAIFLDTLSRNFVGNENAADAMVDYLRGCDELREATGASLLSVHHTGHLEADRGRGHSSLRAALDVEMKVTRDGDRVTLSCTKQKDAAHFPALAFDMLPVSASLVPKAVGTVDHKWTDSRLKAAKALPTEGGLTRAQWAKEADMPPGTLRHALDWLVTMAYARSTRESKYVRTEAGTAALVPECQASASTVPSSQGEGVPRGGCVRSTPVALTPGHAGWI